MEIGQWARWCCQCRAPRHPEHFSYGGWQVRYRRGERQGVGSLPRLGLEESLLDLASEASEDATVASVTRALAQARTTPARLAELVASRPRVSRRQLLTELCGEAAQGLESTLEWRFDKVVLRAHGLPKPQRQVCVGRARLDQRYERYDVVIELDGQRDHQEWSRDMMRDNAHALSLGVVTLRYGWDDTCAQPCAVASQIAAALRLRGWTAG